jgi:hypothetical protein
MTEPAWRSRLDVAATALTIVTLAVLCIILVAQSVRRAETVDVVLSSLPDLLPLGTVLEPVDETGYGSADVTILVGLSTTCQYGEQSMAAFRRLNDRAASERSGRLRILALSAEPQEVLAEHLKAQRLSAFRPVEVVGRTSQISRIASLTPSVVLLDREGTVVGSWAALITTGRLRQIMRSLNERNVRNKVVS